MAKLVTTYGWVLGNFEAPTPTLEEALRWIFIGMDLWILDDGEIYVSKKPLGVNYNELKWEVA